MGLFEKHKNDLIDVIQWGDTSVDSIVWRFPSYQSEIKNGAQLIVRNEQIAVLVDNGQVADIYYPSKHELTTHNMPILSVLKGWKYSFESPFKAEVYFVTTRPFRGMRWQMPTPVVINDPEFGEVPISAMGSYSFCIKSDPTLFINNIIEIEGHFTSENIHKELCDFVVNKFVAYLNEYKIPLLDFVSSLNEVSVELLLGLRTDFADYGIDLMEFSIENITIPINIKKEMMQEARE